MHKLVLLRHGESVWNSENRFTGWVDVGLSKKGEQEALEAGRLLANEGFRFDTAFTSMLKRAIKTLWIALEQTDRMWIPIHNSWRLNERHYGALTGLNKAETAARHGLEQTNIWRRSYNIQPPAMLPGDPSNPALDERYTNLASDQRPLTESLEDTVKRFLPYWHETIAPAVKRGRRVIIAAHGNSLRALVKYLDGLSDAEIVGLNIPTGIPLVYELDAELKPVSHYYLGDQEAIREAAEKVANQTRGA